MTLDAMVEARDHGVDPDYVGGLEEAGFDRLTIEQLIHARDHGVDGAYVSGMGRAGYTKSTLDELVRARDHGVDESYARKMQKLHGKIELDELDLDARPRRGLSLLDGSTKHPRAPLPEPGG